MELKVTVSIRREHDMFVAYCEEYDLSASSVTIEDSLTELQRKIHDYLEDEQLSITTSIVFVIKMPI